MKGGKLIHTKAVMNCSSCCRFLNGLNEGCTSPQVSLTHFSVSVSNLLGHNYLTLPLYLIRRVAARKSAEDSHNTHVLLSIFIDAYFPHCPGRPFYLSFVIEPVLSEIEMIDGPVPSSMFSPYGLMKLRSAYDCSDICIFW